MIIPGRIIDMITFPGVVMKAVARRLWCDVLRIDVYEVRYFEGTVIHAPIETVGHAALLAFAPMSVNTALCAVLMFPLYFTLDLGVDLKDSPALFILLWTGFSVGMHALPSSAMVIGYLKGLPDAARRGVGFAVLRTVVVPSFVMIDVLKRFWIDAVYVVLVGTAAPALVTWAYIALHR
jgi:hypothetical protein